MNEANRSTSLPVDIDPQDLRDLIDKQKIHDLLMAYCRGIDRHDLELLRTIFFSDGYDDHGVFIGNAWDYIDFVAGTTVEKLTHLVGNVLIELHGDTANSESYFVATHVRDDGDGWGLYEIHGRYLDHWERREGRWGIVHRTLVHDWSEIRKAQYARRPDAQVQVQGLRSTEDPVYGSFLERRPFRSDPGDVPMDAG